MCEEFDPQAYMWTSSQEMITLQNSWIGFLIRLAVLFRRDIDTGAANVDDNTVSLVLESVASSCGQGIDPFISKFHLDGTKLTDSIRGEVLRFAQERTTGPIERRRGYPLLEVVQNSI